MNTLKLIRNIMVSLICVASCVALEFGPEKTTLAGPFPSILNQSYNDCAINAVASAIEYLTQPRAGNVEGNPLYPLKISRSGLYTLTKYHSFSCSEEWKKGQFKSWQHDHGVDMGTTLVTLGKCGCFPEDSVTLPTGYVVPGWEYARQSKAISPDVLRLGLDSRLDGISPSMRHMLLEASVVQRKDVCEVENPYAKVHARLVYELIERPRSFDAAFYQTLKTYLKDDKPIVMGISVTKDFMQCSRKGLIRGVGCKASDFHVVLLLGVEEHRGVKECFHIQNSWGASWGDMGRGYLSKEYFENNFYGGYALSLPGFFKEA